MYTNPGFKCFVPKASQNMIQLGCACNWYDHETADAIAFEQLGFPGPYTSKQVMYVQGWFAEYGWNDPYADYASNSWVGDIIGGPFRTQEEAYQYAQAYIADYYPENGC